MNREYDINCTGGQVLGVSPVVIVACVVVVYHHRFPMWSPLKLVIDSQFWAVIVFVAAACALELITGQTSLLHLHHQWRYSRCRLAAHSLSLDICCWFTANAILCAQKTRKWQQRRAPWMNESVLLPWGVGDKEDTSSFVADLDRLLEKAGAGGQGNA